MVITFNALSYSKQLKAVGVTPQQAEVHAETLANVLYGHSTHVATKADLELFAAKAEQMFATKKDLELFATKTDLNSGLKELEYKLTIKLGAVVTVVVGAIATIAKLF
jgi:hypothetical protein